MNWKAQRQEHLNKKLKEAYKLLEEYDTEIIYAADPQERGKIQNKIKNIKEDISRFKKDLDDLEKENRHQPIETPDSGVNSDITQTSLPNNKTPDITQTSLPNNKTPDITQTSLPNKTKRRGSYIDVSPDKWRIKDTLWSKIWSKIFEAIWGEK